MNIRILQANKNDLEQILELQKECYQAEAKIYNDFSIPPLTQDLKSLKKDFENQTILKAEINGELVASVRAFRKNETCYIGRLIVSPNFQNKGIGKDMMDAIETAFTECKRFELFTGFKSIKNLHLYKKLGYMEFKHLKENKNLTIVFLEKTNIHG